MTNDEFRTWLAGFYELSDDDTTLTRRQLFVIGNHLNLAEAVEGKLDSFNDALREMVRDKVGQLHDMEDLAEAEFVQEIRAKVLAKIAA